MAQFTKKAIMASFIKLLNKKLFDKITVKDIVDDCGVNRNTFYYHFEDIYALLLEVFRDETDKIVNGDTEFDSWQDGFLRAVKFAFENQEAIRNLYNSLNREVLEKYLYTVTDDIMYGFVRREAGGLEVSEDDIRLISDFYKFALVGKLLEWVGSGMNRDISKGIARTAEVFDGSIHEALVRCEGKSRQII